MQQKLCYPSQNQMGMGRKSHGYGTYTDEATWNMETQAQLQNHNFHDESYSSDESSYHKQQFQVGMPMKHGGAYATEHSMSKHHGLGKLGGGGGNHGMFDSISGGHGHGHGHGHGLGNGHGNGYGQHGAYGGHAHGGGQKYPFGGATGNAGHHYSNGGGMFNNHGGGGHNNGYVSEEYEYEAHNMEHGGGVTAKMEEKRYERHGSGGDVYYANPYGHNRKPHGYGHVGHKVEWTAKGV